MRLEFIIAGLVVGILVGLTGTGGGTVMTPILILLGVRPTLAIGSDLAYSSVTKLIGAIQHGRLGQIRLRPALFLSLGSIPASLLGVYIIARLRMMPGVNVEHVVTRFLAWTLVIVAALLIIQPFVTSYVWPKDQPNVFLERLRVMRRHRPKALVVVGLVIGLLVGLTSVGGGSMVMIAMLLLFPKWPMRQRVGTDVFQSFLFSVAAAAGHWALGNVNPTLVVELLIGSIPGVLLGARLTAAMPERLLRPLVVGVIAFSAWKLL
ncbi:MAG TPA: sulfite exporter TauE/SafE family protein [Ktedonobacterales bacterium]